VLISWWCSPSGRSLRVPDSLCRDCRFAVGSTICCLLLLVCDGQMVPVRRSFSSSIGESIPSLSWRSLIAACPSRRLLIVRDGAARLSKCVRTSSGGCPEYRRRRDYGRVPLVAAAVLLEVLGFWDCCGAGGQEVPSSGREPRSQKK
jgi:hypothetical protein